MDIEEGGYFEFTQEGYGNLSAINGFNDSFINNGSKFDEEFSEEKKFIQWILCCKIIYEIKFWMNILFKWSKLFLALIDSQQVPW